MKRRDAAAGDIIGFSANNLISAVFSGMLAKKIKKDYPDKPIIVGGPGIYHSWDRNSVDASAIDYFIIGEGEISLGRFISEFLSQL